MGLCYKTEIFGLVQCSMYTIEWQKRGLPHVHLLLWLKLSIHDNDIDKFILGEILDRRVDPILNEIIVNNMVYNECGPGNPTTRCMKDGRCEKRFPKEFAAETYTNTHIDTHSYAAYR